MVEQHVGLSMAQGRLKRRRGEYKGLVVHTTGSGPYRRHQEAPERFPLPYDAALHIYKHISPYCAHFLVCGESGQISQLVPLDYVAWHVGSKGSWRYKLSAWDKNKGLGWWHTRHPHAKSPRGLLGGALWRSGSCNALTVGVEVSPPLAGARAPWSDACWDTLNRLIVTLDVPRDSGHVFTHSDAHPLARTKKSGAPWDPSPAQWMIGNARIRLEIA